MSDTKKSPLKVLTEAFPGQSVVTLLGDIIQDYGAQAKNVVQELAARFFPLPSWSKDTLDAPIIATEKRATLGASVWCYYRDPNKLDRESGTRGEPQVLLVKRGRNRDAQGNPQYGATGGYMELGKLMEMGEQPEHGACREAAEETADDQGKPVLSLTPERLRSMVSGVDYRKPELPVQYTGHACELTKEEFTAISNHAVRMATDPAYAADVEKQTHGEVLGFKIMTLSKALQMQPQQFAHPHELKALTNLQALIAQDRQLGR